MNQSGLVSKETPGCAIPLEMFFEKLLGENFELKVESANL